MPAQPPALPQLRQVVQEPVVDLRLCLHPAPGAQQLESSLEPLHASQKIVAKSLNYFVVATIKGRQW